MDDLPLVEKYRPQKLDDIVGNTNQIIFFKKFIESGNIPNLLLNGEPGGGKTSAVIAMAKEYLGDLYADYCMELNASDERGIDIVRSKIKIFSQRKSCCNKYKIIILDESDNMTNPAQLALKRIMDQYEDTTRFFFTCNSIENIISSIQSKCKIMYFGRIEEKDIVNRLDEICKLENLNIQMDGILSIIELSSNKMDVREMLNKIELIKANYSDEEITKHHVYHLCDKPSPIIIREFIDEYSKKNLQKCITLIHKLKDDGYQSSDICITLNNEIMNTTFFTEKCKKLLMMIIGEYNLLFLEGNESYLMMGGMICEMFSKGGNICSPLTPPPNIRSEE
jgi:replication factor C subunit 2/4